MTTAPETFNELFGSFDNARAAYLRLEQRASEMTDADLARDADYRVLFTAGRRIESLGGRAAIEGAIDAFFPDDETRTERARRNLGHWWAGFGTWQIARPLLH